VPIDDKPEPIEPNPIDPTGGEPAPNASGKGQTPATMTEEPLPTRGQFIYVEELPVPITSPKPVYPEIATQAGVEGKVLVHILIGKDGRVLRAEVDEHVHVTMLDQAALEAARQWIFKPALSNNHPVPVWETLPFVFKLH